MSDSEHGTAIEFICVVPHAPKDQSAVTVHEGRWAYCLSGGNGKHTWVAITPTPLMNLQRNLHVIPGS